MAPRRAGNLITRNMASNDKNAYCIHIWPIRVTPLEAHCLWLPFEAKSGTARSHRTVQIVITQFNHTVTSRNHIWYTSWFSLAVASATSSTSKLSLRRPCTLLEIISLLCSILFCVESMANQFPPMRVYTYNQLSDLKLLNAEPEVLSLCGSVSEAVRHLDFKWVLVGRSPVYIFRAGESPPSVQDCIW